MSQTLARRLAVLVTRDLAKTWPDLLKCDQFVYKYLTNTIYKRTRLNIRI